MSGGNSLLVQRAVFLTSCNLFGYMQSYSAGSREHAETVLLVATDGVAAAYPGFLPVRRQR